jgi:hypothetical protein
LEEVQVAWLRSFERARQEPNDSTAVYDIEDTDLEDGEDIDLKDDDCENGDLKDDDCEDADLEDG